MRAIQSSPNGIFFYTLSYIVTLTAVLLWHPLIPLILAASLIFVPAAVWLAIIIKPMPRVTKSIKKIKACFILWGFQGAGFLVMLIITALWFARFPTAVVLTPNFAHHLSLSLLFSSFFLSTLLMMFSTLAQRWQQPISINLFFPKDQQITRLANFSNFWLFKATMMPGLLLFMLACSGALSNVKLNLIALLISTLFIGASTKSAWFYQTLQIMIKRWKCGFASIVIIFFAVISLCSFLMSWMMKPLGVIPIYNLTWIGNTAPLLLFWSLSLAITIPITYCVAPRIFALTPRNILLLSLSNPMLWLIIWLDYRGNLLHTLQNLSSSTVHTLSIITLILSYFFLNSNPFAKLSTMFFGHLRIKHQGPMPRNLVYRNFSLLILIMIAFIINAVFVLQIEFLVTAACTAISVIIVTYLFLFRASL
jgi:hypothetical protein